MISIVLCTHNRSRSLSRALGALGRLVVSKSLPWELLVVDNNSMDDTPRIVKDFASGSRCRVRYAFEARQGHSWARNRGVAEARGDVIAFTDDDVLVREDWLESIAAAFARHEAACVGGKILPLWERPCPEWLGPEFHPDLALLDYGDRPFLLDLPRLWGANFALKASMFRKYGGFEPELGRTPGRFCSREETEFLGRLLKGGEEVLYDPGLVVHHVIPAERLLKSYFRKRRFDQGELNGRTRFLDGAGARGLSAKECAYILGLYAGALLARSGRSFPRELNLWYTAGFMKGRLSRRRWVRCLSRSDKAPAPGAAADFP